MTLEAWVNPTTLTGWREVILKEAANVLAYGLYAHNNAPHPAATIQVGGLDREASGTAALPLNTWSASRRDLRRGDAAAVRQRHPGAVRSRSRDRS